jgi:hypothetical protein
MCHFITLVVPTDDVAAVHAVLQRHGRAATLIENHSIRAVLRDGERQYLTMARACDCDCGTVLGAGRHTPEALAVEGARETARMKRKGWSDAKIARAIDAAGKAGARRSMRGPDSIALWDAVLRDLGGELKLPYAGLFVRDYSGGIEDGVFDATRREMAKGAARQDGLAAMDEDEVVIFPLE